MLVLLLGLPLIYVSGAMHPFSSPKLAILGLAVFLFMVSLWSESSIPLSRPTKLAVAGLLLFGALALANSPSFALSFWGAENEELGAFAMLLSLGAFLLGAYSLPLLDSQPWIRYALVLPVIPLALMLLPWGTGLLPGYFGSSRFSLSFGHPIHLGNYAGVVLLFSVVLVTHTTGRPRVFMLAAALSSAGLLLASQSRGGLLATVLCLLLYGSLKYGRFWKGRKFIRRLPLGLAAILVLMVGLSVLAPRMVNLSSGDSVRRDIWVSGLKALPGSALVGSGPATFKLHHLEYFTSAKLDTLYPRAQPIAANAHNWFLEYAVTYGLPFALLVTLLVALPVRRFRRMTAIQRASYLASLVVWIAGLFNPLSITTLGIAMLLLGYSSAQPAPRPATVASPAKYQRYWLKPTLVIGGLLLFLQTSAFLYVDERAKTYDLEGDTPALAHLSVLQAPDRPSFLRTLGARYAFDIRFGGRGDLAGEVDRVFTRATAIDPSDITTWMGWGTALQVLDRHEDAIKKFEATLQLVPAWPVAERSMAYSYAELGQRDKAKAMLRDILRRHPDDGGTKQVLAVVLADQSQE